MSEFSWPDDEIVFPVNAVDIFRDEDEHPLLSARQEEIAHNWDMEVAAKPALFNGEILLHRGLKLDSTGRVTGVTHLTPFAAYLWWRKQSPRPDSADHLFPLAIPITTDGAVLAIEMGEHTSNAGRVYCAAGSLDASDLAGSKVDLERNMIREVAEETGIDLRQARKEPGLTGVRLGRTVTVFQIFRLDFDAEEARRRVLAHMEQDHEKEIARAVIIRDGNLQAQNYAPFMRPVLKMIFNPEAPLTGTD